MAKYKKITAGVGKRIKEVRQELGMSQQAFADRIGLAQMYVSMLERGARKPSQVAIIAIAAKFDLDENWLRTGRYLKNGA